MVVTGPQVTMERELPSTILFNACKKEVFTTNNGYKSMQKRLRSNWKIQSLKDEITSEKLIGVKLWITAGPREKFTAAENRQRMINVEPRTQVLAKMERNWNLCALLVER
uniref:Intraflagellar transport 52 n=1 Tax=Ailuropoda melanoleuca TaxID=9646 RepID=A0A7N5J8X4_AILME